MIVDCALYEDGRRLPLEPTAEALAALDEHPRAFAWIGYAKPSVPELTSSCERLGLLPAIDVAEVLSPHRRPVLSVEEGIIHLVLRTARYDDRGEKISLGELTLLATDRAVVAVRYGHASPLGALRSELENDPDRLRAGPAGVVAAIVEQVIADYSPALDGFEQDAIEVESEVFSVGGPQPVRRLYALKREVRTFQSPLDALEEPLARLARHLRHRVDHEVIEDLHEAIDQLGRTIGRTRSLSNLLDAASTASLAQTELQQNADMRKISAWVAMAAVPTLIAGIYGMNFDHMPELGARVGYPVVLIVMALIMGVMYRMFRRNGWL